MDTHPNDLTVGALSHGAHAVLLYSSGAEQADVLETFVDAALNANDRLLYVGDREHGERGLKAYGTAGARALSSGQFLIEDSDNTYMAGGRFDAARMLAHYGGAVDAAIADGYSGLRVAADMGWAVRGLDRKDGLVQYERAINQALGGRAAVVLCQFDRRLFDDEVLVALTAAHTHTAHPEPLHQSMQLRVARTYEPHGVQAFGEIDVSSRAAFREALLRVASSPESRMVIDLRGVQYLDAGSVGAIVSAAQQTNRTSIEIRFSRGLRRIFETLEPTLPRTVHVEEAE